MQGTSTSGQGIFGQVTTPVAASTGILGSAGSAFSNTYTTESGAAFAGIWADTSGTETTPPFPVALFGTADDAYAGAFINNRADFRRSQFKT